MCLLKFEYTYLKCNFNMKKSRNYLNNNKLLAALADSTNKLNMDTKSRLLLLFNNLNPL